MTERINVGDTVKAMVTFTDSTGKAADPSIVRLEVQKPDGTTAAYATGFTGFDGQARDAGSGEYRYDLSLDQGGTWLWRWIATGAVVAAEPDRVYVERNAFTVGA